MTHRSLAEWGEPAGGAQWRRKGLLRELPQELPAADAGAGARRWRPAAPEGAASGIATGAAGGRRGGGGPANGGQRHRQKLLERPAADAAVKVKSGLTPRSRSCYVSLTRLFPDRMVSSDRFEVRNHALVKRMARQRCAVADHQQLAASAG